MWAVVCALCSSTVLQFLSLLSGIPSIIIDAQALEVLTSYSISYNYVLLALARSIAQSGFAYLVGFI